MGEPAHPKAPLLENDMVTADVLRALEACDSSVRDFERHFPHGLWLPPPGAARNQVAEAMAILFGTVNVIWFVKAMRLSVVISDPSRSVWEFCGGRIVRGT